MEYQFISSLYREACIPLHCTVYLPCTDIIFFSICIPLTKINESYFWAFQIFLSMKFGVGYFIHEQILHYYNAMFI